MTVKSRFPKWTPENGHELGVFNATSVEFQSGGDYVTYGVNFPRAEEVWFSSGDKNFLYYFLNRNTFPVAKKVHVKMHPAAVRFNGCTSEFRGTTFYLTPQNYRYVTAYRSPSQCREVGIQLEKISVEEYDASIKAKLDDMDVSKQFP